MKKGPTIPGWAAGVGIAALVLLLLIFGIKAVGSGGPLPESQYPKEAFKPPSYDPSKYAGYTKNGVPVGASANAPSSASTTPSDPYSKAYGPRPSNP